MRTTARCALALFLLVSVAPALAQRSSARAGTPQITRLPQARPGLARGTTAPLIVHRLVNTTTDSIPWSALASLFPQQTPNTPFILSPANIIDEGRGFLSFANAITLDPRDGGDATMSQNGIVLVGITAEAGRTYLVEFVGRHMCTVTDDPCPADQTMILEASVNGQNIGAQPLVIPGPYPVGVITFQAPTAGQYYINVRNNEPYVFKKVRIRALD